MVEVEFASGSFAEIYQQVNMQFAFCSLSKTETGTKIKQLHGFIKCRDFLGDALVASNREKGINIYNFSWSQGINGKVPQDQTSLLVKYADKDRLVKQLILLNKIEKELKWKRSKLVDTKKLHGNIPVFLITSSKKWVSNTVLISVYTILWRLAGVNKYTGQTIDDYLKECTEAKESNDQGYLCSIYSDSKILGLKKNPIMAVLKDAKKIFNQAYPPDELSSSDHIIHYNNGIQSLFENTRNKKFNTQKSSFSSTWQKNLYTLIEKAKEE